jgi:hypothetical protein
MKTIIYTSFPCLIRYEDSEVSLDENEHLTIDEPAKKIEVYPSSKGQISFVIDFNKIDSPFYRIITKNDKILVFLLNGLYAENVNCYNFSEKSKIEVFSDKIIFKSDNNKKIVHLNENILDIKCGQFFHISYCAFSRQNDKKSLIAYNNRTGQAKIFDGNNIEITNNGFILTSSPQGYQNITQEYYVDKDGLKLKTSNFVSCQSFVPNEIIAYNFMTAIKCEDYEGAKKFLSEALLSSLNSTALKNYFGKITYFYMISPLSCFALSDGNNKIYTFSQSQNKITEIYDE